MINQLVIVGRVEKVTQKENKTILTLKVPRKHKNSDGEYENDIIDCNLIYHQVTSEYLKKSDIVVIRGYLSRPDNESEIELIAEKVTFLDHRKNKEEE